MKLKNIITAFLILVLVLQLLPVRQAVKYFLIDNQTVEEIVHVEKGPSKHMRLLLDEDHTCMPAIDYLSDHFILLSNNYPFHTAETIPLFHAADIPTPPPNYASIVCFLFSSNG